MDSVGEGFRQSTTGIIVSASRFWGCRQEDLGRSDRCRHLLGALCAPPGPGPRWGKGWAPLGLPIGTCKADSGLSASSPGSLELQEGVFLQMRRGEHWIPFRSEIWIQPLLCSYKQVTKTPRLKGKRIRPYASLSKSIVKDFAAIFRTATEHGILNIPFPYGVNLIWILVVIFRGGE